MVNHINIKSSAASFLDVVQMSQNSSQDLAINTGEIDYMPNAVAADGRIHELQEHHPNIRFRQVSVDLQGGISTYIFDADGLLTMTQLVSVRTEDESIVTTLISKSFRQAGKFNSTKSNAEETWTQSTQAKQRNIIKRTNEGEIVIDRKAAAMGQALASWTKQTDIEQNGVHHRTAERIVYLQV